MKTKNEVQETKKSGKPLEGTAVPAENTGTAKTPGKRRGRPKTTGACGSADKSPVSAAETAETAKTAEPQAPAAMPAVTPAESTENTAESESTVPPAAPAETAETAKTAEPQAPAAIPAVTPAESTENTVEPEPLTPPTEPPAAPAETAETAKAAEPQAPTAMPAVTPMESAENTAESKPLTPPTEPPAEPREDPGTALTTIPSSIEPLTKEQMKTEYRKRTEIIKDQLSSIQQSFLVIAFQLYWIKENAMFPSAYKNIYEFADVEYGISRSTCGNLIYIVDTYAERDGDGRVLESLEGRYRDFSASQLIAMAGMPEEDREKVRPDMSVRMINRMRKQEAQARLGSGREADTAQKDTAGTDPRTVPGQEEPAAARAAAGSETAEDSREPQTSAGISTDRPHTEKDAPAAGASPETETGEPDGKAPGTDTGRDGDGIPAGRGTAADPDGDGQDGGGQPEPTGRPGAQREEMKVFNTLLSFTSYSRYEKEQEYLRTLIKNVFDDSSGAVTVKVIYEKATA